MLLLYSSNSFSILYSFFCVIYVIFSAFIHVIILFPSRKRHRLDLFEPENNDHGMTTTNIRCRV